MRKSVSIWLLAMATLAFSGCQPRPVDPSHIYVDANWKPNQLVQCPGNNGSIDCPFLTVPEGVASVTTGGIVEVRPGNYDVTPAAPLVLDRSLYLIGTPTSAAPVLRRSDVSGVALEIAGASDVTVSHLAIEPQGTGALEVQSSKRVVFSDVRFDGTSGVGLALLAGVSDVVFDQCQFLAGGASSGSSLIEIALASGVSFEQVTVDATGVDTAIDTFLSSNVIVHDSTISGSTGSGIQMAGVIDPASLVIQNSTISSNGAWGVYASIIGNLHQPNSGSLEITGSRILSNGSGGILVEADLMGTLSATISTNEIRDQATGTGVRCSESAGSVLLTCAGNTFTGNLEDVGADCGTTCL